MTLISGYRIINQFLFFFKLNFLSPFCKDSERRQIIIIYENQHNVGVFEWESFSFPLCRPPNFPSQHKHLGVYSKWEISSFIGLGPLRRKSKSAATQAPESSLNQQIKSKGIKFRIKNSWHLKRVKVTSFPLTFESGLFSHIIFVCQFVR